jgi:chitodextrinase
MRQSGWSRMRRPSIWALVIAICAVPLSVSAMAASPASYSAALTAPASASEHGRTRISGFNDDRTTVKVGLTVVDSVVVVPRARRTVEVQARRPGSSTFVTQSRGRTTAAGAFRAVYAPTSAGTWRFRLRVLPSATRGAATSDTRVLNAIDVTAPRAVSTLQVSGISLDSATLTWVNPTDKDFTGVTIRRAAGAMAPASQLDGTAVKDTAKNATEFTDTALTAGTEYSYALFAHDTSGNYSRGAVVTLRTGRFGVSFLQATSVTRNTVTLAWANPTDDAFAGVIVRRAEGPTPPASAIEGTAVGDDLTSGEASATDTGLSPGTTYSYAVFAHDGAGHVAAAATTTATTRGNGVSAVLSVNPLPLVHAGNRVTVDTAVAFDGSESLPAVDARLVAWDIDYGDHDTDSFNGPLSSVDVLNTTHTFTNAGPTTVTLTVTDSAGNTDSFTLTVQVFDAPKVSISTSGSSPADAGVVPFEVRAETPLGTKITSYRMKVSGDESFFVDGDSAPPNSQDVTFAPGRYRVVLTMTNDAGGTAVSDPVDVEVS